MGFLDSLLGSTRLPKAKTEKLFAISTARVTMEAQLGVSPDGAAAVCLKPVESSSYGAAQAEVEELLGQSSKDTGTEYKVSKDEYGFLWVVLRDRDFDDLVVAVHMVSQILTERDFGQQLLCAVYRFRGEKIVYWIYSFKQGSYYPFVPLAGQERDSALEFRLKALMEKEMPVEKDLERWYPMWGMPI
jgi:hypothetical protein